MLDGGRALFLPSVKSKSVPGALGWGRMGVFEASQGLSAYGLKPSMGFESEVGNSARPSCHSAREPVVGSTERIFGGRAACVEEKCASAGDSYCLFAVTVRGGP